MSALQLHLTESFKRTSSKGGFVHKSDITQFDLPVECVVYL